MQPTDDEPTTGAPVDDRAPRTKPLSAPTDATPTTARVRLEIARARLALLDARLRVVTRGVYNADRDN